METQRDDATSETEIEASPYEEPALESQAEPAVLDKAPTADDSAVSISSTDEDDTLENAAAKKRMLGSEVSIFLFAICEKSFHDCLDLQSCFTIPL